MPPRDTVFLERRAYRRRRLSDAAGLLPVAGVVALLLPVIWAGAPTPTDGGTPRAVATENTTTVDPLSRAPASTAQGGLYLFAVWGILITASAVVSGRLAAASRTIGRGEGDAG